MIIFNYTVTLFKETHTWTGEDMVHAWEWILRVERLTPKETEHRAFLKANKIV